MAQRWIALNVSFIAANTYTTISFLFYIILNSLHAEKTHLKHLMSITALTKAGGCATSKRVGGAGLDFASNAFKEDLDDLWVSTIVVDTAGRETVEDDFEAFHRSIGKNCKTSVFY